ncbi:MAG: urea ABC transporter permease subunit UrtB [Pseudomonadales bacterium]|nr:urea ABC transporter permease subunit UrtB [Pseudomonadales bacterium]
MRWLLLLLTKGFLCVWLAALPMLSQAEDADSNEGDSAAEEVFNFDEAVKGLDTKSYKVKGKKIQGIALSGHEKALDVLMPLSEGNLFAVKETGVIVEGIKEDSLYTVTDILSGEKIGQLKKKALRKIRINNKLRRQLRGLMAMLELTHPDDAVRLAAADNIIKSPTESMLPFLAQAIEKEEVSAIKDSMIIAQGIIWTTSDVTETRFKGVEAIGAHPHQAVKGALLRVLQKDEEGNYLEPNAYIIEAAEKGLLEYERQENVYKLIENLFFGLSAGSVLLLAAVGLAITFGVMGVINMAHGEMIMLGAYTTFVVQQLMPNSIEYSLFVAIPAAFIVSGLFGIAIERGVIRYLYGRPLETLLATFGISLILQQLVRSIFSPLNRAVITPEWMSGSWHVNGMLSLTYNRIYIVIFSVMVFVGLILLLKRTHFGLQMRAVTLNRPMASSMGIRTGWVDALTFGLGSGIAGIAGVAISQLTNVGPNLGQSYIIDSFMVVVFGGVGNLFGTLFGAMSLGIINKFAEPWTGAVLAKILILVAIILFIQRRPRGMFALKGRFVEA